MKLTTDHYWHLSTYPYNYLYVPGYSKFNYTTEVKRKTGKNAGFSII